MRIPRLLFAVALVATLAPACGSDTSTSPATTTTTVDPASELPITDVVDERGNAEVTVVMRDNTFEPKVVRVDPGTKVTWVNKGANVHNVVPNVAGQMPRLPADETTDLRPGETASHTFTEAGVVRYYCKIHGIPASGQRGAIVVGDA